MKSSYFYLLPFLFIATLGCQKMEIPKDIKSFYPDSIDGVSYVDSLNYEVIKGDGETFDINLKFEAGSGFESIKIVNHGLNAQLSYHATKEVTEIFTVTSPEKGVLSGNINVTGQMNYSDYYSGAVSDIDKYSFHFHLVDKMGVTRFILIKFVKP